MPRNGSGGYIPPLNSWNPPINGAAATPADWQAILNDLATAIQASIAADGQTPITGVLNFNNNRISGVGAPIGQGNALRWEQLTKGSNIASATTINIPNEGAFFEITGTTDIAAITDTYPGRVVFLRFQDVLTLENSAGLVMPTGADIQTAAGDVAIFLNETTGVWKCVYYPIVLAAGVAYDNTVSELTATNVQIAIDEISQAAGVKYDNTVSALTAENVQAAIDELAAEKLDADKNIVLGTAVTLTNQTAVDFTGIPATAKRITVMFNGVSTSGASNPLVQLGAGGVTTTGYVATSSRLQDSTPVSVTNSTAGFPIASTSAANILNGAVQFSKQAGNVWVAQGALAATSVATFYFTASGVVSLSDTLTTVRITTVNGTDQFDAGTINISWE